MPADAPSGGDASERNLVAGTRHGRPEPAGRNGSVVVGKIRRRRTLADDHRFDSRATHEPRKARRSATITGQDMIPAGQDGNRTDLVAMLEERHRIRTMDVDTVGSDVPRT